MKKLLALFLSLIFVLSLFAGCGRQETPAPPDSTDTDTQTPAETPDEPQLSDEEIIQARREAAVAYAREVANVRWRSDADLVYKHTDTSAKSFHIVAGRLYEGVPYSYSGATLGAFLDYAGSVDEKGVYQISGLTKKLLGSNSDSSRIGIDCSGLVNRSWQSFGASVRPESTSAMTTKNGYVKVGEYESPEKSYKDTTADCAANGTEKMFEAYALLQMADAVVKVHGSGHVMMALKVNVVRDETGAIDGYKSTCTVIDQVGTQLENTKYFDESIGEDVYTCVRQDYDFTFYELFYEGYLPITCKELVDASPVKEAVLADSLDSKPGLYNLFSGAIGCTQAIDMVKIEIVDKAGKVAQSSVCHPVRRTCFAVNMSQFMTDGEERLQGLIEKEYLEMGDYHCTVTARTVTGETLVARDFDFTVDTPPAERPAETEKPGLPDPLATVTLGSTSVDVYTVDDLAIYADESGNSVITLQKDVFVEGTTQFPYSCTIDLNGHTWTSTQGNCIAIARAGKENPIAVLKNGTVKHVVVGFRVNAGGFVVSNVVMQGSGGSNVGYYDNSGKYNDQNLIEKSILVSDVYSVFSYNSKDTDFTGTNVTIRDSALITPKDAMLLFTKQTGTTPGTVTFGPGVTMYSKKPDSYAQGGYVFEGEKPVLDSEKYSVEVPALGLKKDGFCKWATSASSAAPDVTAAQDQSSGSVDGPVSAEPIVKVTNGSETKEVKSLKEMQALISPTGKTVVTLLDDILSTENIVFPYTCTIDLNGHALTAENDGSTGNAILIEAAGSESRHTVVKNGTVNGNSLGIRVNAGSIEVDGVTILSDHAPAIGMYGGDFVEGEVNVIRNCTIYTDHTGAFSWHKNDGPQDGRNILFENCTIVVENVAGYVFRTRNSGGTVTLGENVTVYTTGPAALVEGNVTLAGKTLTAKGAASVTAAGKTVENAPCWTTTNS